MIVPLLEALQVTGKRKYRYKKVIPELTSKRMKEIRYRSSLG